MLNCWYNEIGELHRIDGPAKIDLAGTEFWFNCGILHRIDGPAVIFKNGTKMWYVDGVQHRAGAPAVENSDGTGAWYWKGVLVLNATRMTYEQVRMCVGHDFIITGYSLNG